MGTPSSGTVSQNACSANRGASQSTHSVKLASVNLLLVVSTSSYVRCARSVGSTARKLAMRQASVITNTRRPGGARDGSARYARNAVLVVDRNVALYSGSGPQISSADQKFSPRQYRFHDTMRSASTTRIGG